MDPSIGEWVIPIHSGVYESPILIGAWNRQIAFPGTDCSSQDPFFAECFAGDYRYGAFYQKAGDSLSFFTPWTGASPTAAPGAFAQGRVIHVAR